MLRCRNVFAIFLALLTGCASAPRVDLAAPLPRIRYLLTFDDGPSSASSRNSTASIADKLAQNPTQNGIKAIFFVQTRARTAGGSDTGKKLMQRLFAEGHVLGLHSGSARGHVKAWAIVTDGGTPYSRQPRCAPGTAAAMNCAGVSDGVVTGGGRGARAQVQGRRDDVRVRDVGAGR